MVFKKGLVLYEDQNQLLCNGFIVKVSAEVWDYWSAIDCGHTDREFAVKRVDA